MGNKIQISKLNIFVIVYFSKTLPIDDDTENILALSSCVRRQLLLLDLSTHSHCPITPGKDLVENQRIVFSLMLSSVM